MTIFAICSCVVLIIVGGIFIYKVNNFYNGMIEENVKKYTDHIDDWYYEIVEVEE